VEGVRKPPIVVLFVFSGEMGGLLGKSGRGVGEGLNQVLADLKSGGQEVASIVTDIKVIGRRGNVLESAKEGRIASGLNRFCLAVVEVDVVANVGPFLLDSEPILQETVQDVLHLLLLAIAFGRDGLKCLCVYVLLSQLVHGLVVIDVNPGPLGMQRVEGGLGSFPFSLSSELSKVNKRRKLLVKNAFKIAFECGALTVEAPPLAGASAGHPWCTRLKGVVMLKTVKNLVYGMAGNIQDLVVVTCITLRQSIV
jgi:predicted RNA-binding protein YlqC (UPF0109 family)